MRQNTKTNGSMSQVNMTPIIDIVFLLIIFFMLVCQFIVAENFEVEVPDAISSAVSQEEQTPRGTTLTVMRDPQGQVQYAVGPEIIAAENKQRLVNLLMREIDHQLKFSKIREGMVTIRIDKEIEYLHTRHAIAAVSGSKARQVKLSVIREKIANGDL